MDIADHKQIDDKVSSCAPDLTPKWTKSGGRVDIIPKNYYTFPQAKTLAKKLKLCIADHSKIVVV